MLCTEAYEPEEKDSFGVITLCDGRLQISSDHDVACSAKLYDHDILFSLHVCGQAWFVILPCIAKRLVFIDFRAAL